MPRRFPFFLRPAFLALCCVSLRLAYTSFSPSPSPIRPPPPPPRAAAAAMPLSGPLRLAVLEADTPQPQTRERIGTYTHVFTQLFQGACDIATPPKRLADELAISGHGIVDDLDAYPALDDVDAILISGSRHNSFDSDPWILRLVEYTQAALATGRVRVIGVCFGHQILSRALGCKVGRNAKGWEVAVTDVNLTPEGKKVFGMEKMVCSVPVSGVFFFKVWVGTNPAASESTRCIPTLSPTFPPMPWHSAEMKFALCKPCTPRAGTLPSRDTPSLHKTLSPRFCSTVTRQASSTTSFTTMACLVLPMSTTASPLLGAS